MGVHDVEGHLDRVEFEAAFARHLEHVKVDPRIFVPGETDVAHLAGFLCFHQGGVGAVVLENAVGVLITEDLVMLD